MKNFFVFFVAAIASSSSCFAQEIQTDENGREHYTIGDMKFVAKGETGEGLLAVTEKGARKWPKGRVPIAFDSSVPTSDQKRIYELCNMWGEYSIVECFPRANERNYIEVAYGPASNSYVGLVGHSGKPEGPAQRLNISRISFGGKEDASEGTIIHEFGHALGFRHQHTSPDRDLYLEILEQNIEDSETAREQFRKDKSDKRIAPYDYESIMHYSATQAAKPGKQVIVTKDPTKQSLIGQRTYISAGDALGVAFLYGQDETDTLVATVPDYVNLYRQPYFYSFEYSFPQFGVRTRVTKGGDSSGKWESDKSCEVIIFSHDVVKQSIKAGTLVKMHTVVELETELYRRTLSVPPRDGQSCP